MDKVLKECEEFLRDSKWLRNLGTFKVIGKTKSGRIIPLLISKESFKNKKKKDTRYTVTEEVEEVEI
jgi:hypothetical protein